MDKKVLEKNDKIYVAGNTGLVGSAIVRHLESKDYRNLVFTPYPEYDLRDQSQVNTFFQKEKPDYVFLAAAKVGGILANSTFPAEFIYDNIMIASNVIHASYQNKVKKFLNLGSSCIYPKMAAQPLKEDYLLTGPLEPTNEPYAIAKIAAIKLCRYYNKQYGTNFISVMPTNLYGPGDNFNLETSHVLPALIRKMHLAQCLESNDFNAIRKDLKYYPFSKREKYSESMTDEDIVKFLKTFGIIRDNSCNSWTVSLTLWGSGSPRREFLHVDDLANAVVFLVEKYNASDIGEFVNIGTGKDIPIKELAEMIGEIVGFKGTIEWDTDKPDGTHRKLLDVGRVRRLGWQEKINLMHGIQKTFKWYLDNQINK